MSGRTTQRPSSNSSRSAWNDDGLDAPGRPISSSSDSSGKKSPASEKTKPPAKKERRIKERRENICSRIVGSIWSTRHTQELADKETKARTMLRELLVYALFLIILSAIVFGMTGSTMYTLTKVMTDLFVDAKFADTGNSFSGMLTQTDFWRFAEGPLSDGLYWEKYYNGENVPDDDLGYVYYENKLLGVPRIRQLRVRNDSCEVYPAFDKVIGECYDTWSSSSNDEKAYGLKTETAWVYHEESDLEGSSHGAILGTYPGAGYYQDLATTKNQTLEILAELKENKWVDRGTRVVFIDFSVFNPNINLFCSVRLVVEFPPTGGTISSYYFKSVKLLRYVTIGDFIVMGCEFVYCLFIFYYMIEELIELKRMKLSYFQEFWNIMDIGVLLVSLTCIAFNIYRVVAVERMLDGLLASPDGFPDFERLAYWQFQFNYAVAFMVFMSWFKVFKYISFNKTMTQLTDTISSAKKDVVGFMAMFLIVYFAFAQLGFLFFGTQIADFKSFEDAILTLFRIILGDFNFYQLSDAHSILGPLYFIAYILLVFMVLFNMFLAIINDSYSEVKAQKADAENEFEVVDFFKAQYRKVLSKLNVKRDRLADIQNALTMADANGDNVVEYEEWKAELLLRGYKEREIEEAFARFDVDGNRCLDSDEQAKMLKALEEEKNAIEMDIGEVENKLGVNDDKSRPTTSRPRTVRSRTGRIRPAKGSISEEPTSAKPASRAKKNKNKVVSEVGYGEFTQLSRRVDRMEHSIGSIVTKIDTVLVKLEGMEKAKLKRREAMTKLLDQIADSDDTTEEEKRLYMEKLVREELERWDSEAAISRPGSSMSRPGTSRSMRPGTSKSMR